MHCNASLENYGYRLPVFVTIFRYQIEFNNALCGSLAPFSLLLSHMATRTLYKSKFFFTKTTTRRNRKREDVTTPLGVMHASDNDEKFKIISTLDQKNTKHVVITDFQEKWLLHDTE